MSQTIKKFHWKYLFLIIVLFNLFVCSWYVLNSDIYYHSVIARDFLILREIGEKKIVLIGARTGASGIYHGVFWYYLMFPAYLISGGNPVAVGWFWVILIALFLFAGLRMAKGLFGETVAYLYTILVSGYLMFEANSLTHPAGTVFLAPFFVFFFYKYITSLNPKYLAVVVILAGLLIHLELVMGVPFLILSFAYVFVLQFKRKKFHHLLMFFLIVIPLATYIVFELRHNFFQLRNMIGYIMEGRHLSVNFLSVIWGRINYISMSGIPLVKNLTLNRIILAVFACSFLVLFRKQKRNKDFYLISLYFFAGFFIISLISPYFLLSHHFIAFIPVAFLLLISVMFVGWGRLLIPLFVFAVLFNEIQGILFIRNSYGIIGRSDTSWKFYNNMSRQIFNNNKGDFGYFVFSPDTFAYQGKYAMYYQSRKYSKTVSLYSTKMPTTYLVMAPPPSGDSEIELTGPFWKNNTLQIKKEADEATRYENGYLVEKLSLTDDETKVQFNKNYDPGLSFR